VFDLLLAYGVNIEAPTKLGRTPVITAVAARNWRKAQWLLGDLLDLAAFVPPADSQFT
jgi:hypothetical protein